MNSILRRIVNISSFSIKTMDNNAVSVWIDPTKINSHFGNTPIFGTIEKLLKVEK
jgi:hypothetical protein